MSEKPGAEDLKNAMRELEALNPDLGEVRRSLETEFNYHRLLFDVTRDGVLVYNLSDGTIRDINQTMLYMFGYEEDEILSRGLDFPDIKELKNLCEKACTMEKQLHRKDGSLIWTEITAKHIEMEGESLLFVLISDIDSHKKIEEVLESRRNRLRYILEGTNLGTWEWNVQTGETIFNEYWANILGYTLDEISPTDVNTWKNLVYTEDLERSVNELMAYTRGESEFYDNEYRMVHKDGHLVWIQDRGKVISRTSDGQALWMYGSHQDISDRKRNEEALLREERKYKSILQTSVDGFWLTDLSGRILEVNDAYCRMSGYSREELVGMEVHQLEGVMSPGEVALKIDEVLNHNLKRFNTKHMKKDGTLYDVEVSVQFLEVDRGSMVIFLRDLSVQTEAAARNRLLQDQLLQAQRLESVGRLAGGVAHDFNNMLTVILGNAEFALSQTTSDEVTQVNLKEITRAAQRSADITRQLLAFARKQTIDPKKLDLNDTLAQMLKMIQRLIGENISLTWLPGENLDPIRIDPSQLDQILVNLCINSRDAIPNVGRITIETGMEYFDRNFIKRHPGFQEGSYIRLTVSDDGSGMDRETLEKIFEPFFTTKGLEKGTGLGLATVYGIVKQNGGFINVYSEPGVGTTFKIYFVSDLKNEIVSPKHKDSDIDAPGNELILLVEDEPSILKTTAHMLEALGYRVLSAGTPSEAVMKARQYQRQIDLLLTDVIMPEMNGLELSRQLQSIQPGIRQLYMSGYTANVIAHHGILDEGIHFMPKPFSRDELATRVREALKYP